MLRYTSAKRVSAAGFGNGFRYNVPFGENSGLENLSECSFETLVKVKKFNDEDPGISTIMGIEENLYSLLIIDNNTSLRTDAVFICLSL